MKTYSEKQNAARAAVRGGLTREDVEQQPDGRWAVMIKAAPLDEETDETETGAQGAEVGESGDWHDPAEEPYVDRSFHGNGSPEGPYERDVAQQERRRREKQAGPEVVDNIKTGVEEILERYMLACVAADTDEQRIAAMRTAITEAEALGRAEAKKANRKPRAPREGGASKVDIIRELLLQEGGTTSAEILEKTGWPAVSVPAQAKAAKLTLRSEKDGRALRYFGTPIAAAA